MAAARDRLQEIFEDLMRWADVRRWAVVALPLLTNG